MQGGVSSLLVGLLLAISRVNGEWHEDTGPWVIATRGEPWPLPSSRLLFTDYYSLDAATFKFKVVQENCDVIEEAVKRYQNIIKHESHLAEKYSKYADNSVPVASRSVSALEIRLGQPCEQYPNLGSDESYDLNVPKGLNGTTVTLNSNSVWGILRGLETFSQLLVHSNNGAELVVRGQSISDKPRFGHRGLLLDTSRHYLPLGDILETLEAMSYNKLNVLHWHIVDDNSFPYVSTSFPDLSAKGAYHPTMVYTPEDVKMVVEHARTRGIRVVPEFDTPGHTKSWGSAYPQYLTACYDANGKPSGKLGPMNPLNEQLYDFMRTLLREVASSFPDKYVHLGGDEVLFNCWMSNPEISRYMERNNMTTNYQKLEEMFVKRVLDIVADLEGKAIVWQEVFDNGLKLREGTVVQVWTGSWSREMFDVTDAGYPALLSTCWYLDHVAGGGDWLKYYRCEPLAFGGSEKQRNLVMGGEAAMWGEFVDKNNVHSRIWPRASAVAEILWSPGAQNETEAAERLEEHACRMNRRGIPAQPPNGSGFCLS
ncbi:beta-hexosaminidase subunit beta-like [Copidosoma floridanum]|uniref:beta-hexosaminidase subunit beta-like n=1 Tax=Copidosoma floridanum TaxID=29053 RepID=UPI0006C9722A|nr:beta-hexosaminidase subunit beta-like [Copidosoma floridanum]XP_014208072.1 beta-hexosaminidase subunit beta-like [Copidosoma floridanum]